jgi:5-(carboxyamino)imidazole ribonucleotide mutase
MIAAMTTLPVLGVPVESGALKGQDSLLSIVQMPAGVPVATVSIGGARNAGILAVRMLAASDPSLTGKLADFAASLEASVAEKDAAITSTR